jgi:hypothetical protein
MHDYIGTGFIYGQFKVQDYILRNLISAAAFSDEIPEYG